MFVENVFEECLTFFQKVDKVSSLEYWFWKRGTTRTTSIEHVPPTSFGFVACGAKMEPQRRQTWASCSSLHLNRRSCNRKEVPCANLFVCPQRKKKTKSEWCVFLSRQKWSKSDPKVIQKWSKSDRNKNDPQVTTTTCTNTYNESRSISPKRMPPPTFLPLIGCRVKLLMAPVERTWLLSLTMCLNRW